MSLWGTVTEKNREWDIISFAELDYDDIRYVIHVWNLSHPDGGNILVTGVDKCTVTHLDNIFENCHAKRIHFDPFENEQVMHLDSMFYNCENLIDVVFNGCLFYEIKTANMMFYNCKKLRRLILPIIMNITEVEGMFFHCEKLEHIDFSSMVYTHHVERTFSMCEGCRSLKNADLSSWDTDRLGCTDRMFEDCTSLEEVNVRGWKIEKLLWTSRMFYNCKKLKSIYGISEWKLCPQHIDGMFYACENLDDMDLNTWETIDVVFCDDAFTECSTNVDFSRWRMNVCGELSG